jgi:addiction module RelE/StbE family toxin
MRLGYSKRAVRHIADIFDYIHNDNPEAAAMVVARIRATAQALSLFPQMGHVGHLSGTLEHKVKRLPYVIVYRVEIGDTDRVVILGVYHAHQQRG